MSNNNEFVNCGPISVSEALRRNSGILEVPGMITSMSRIYKMIKAYKTFCNVCKTEQKIICEKPVTEPNKQSLICTQCSTDKKTIYTVITEKSHTSVINIELQDTESFNDIDRLTCLLFDENTKGIRVGERVTVNGELMILGNKSKYGKQFPYLYADSINYENKITTELNELDIAAVKRFCDRSDVINKLAELVEPSVINYNHVKKGLLLIAVNAKYEYRNHLNHNYDITRHRLNAFFIGTPGLAKSKILRASTKLIKRSRYESGESSSGASLTAMVVKEDENYMLRLGPASLAKGAICAINELGAIPPDEQARLLSIAEEGYYTINKYGINAPIIAPTTILASANPVGDDWIDDNVVNDSEFPSIGPMIDRFDLRFIFRREKEKEQIRNYAFSKAEKEDTKIPDYTPFLVKYIEYAGHIDPILSDEAKSMIVEFFTELNYKGFGTNRALDTLFRITRAVARLRLKTLADADDVKEAISFYNVMLLDYQKTTEVPESPRDAACNECIKILQQERIGVAFEELIRQACQNNEYVNRYVYFSNKSLKMRENIRVKNIYEMLKVNPNVKKVQEKPAVLHWFSNVLEESLCDACDTCDREKAMGVKNSSEKTAELTIEKNSSIPISGTHASHISHYSSDILETGQNQQLQQLRNDQDLSELVKLQGTRLGDKLVYDIAPTVGDLSIQNNFIGGHLRMRAEGNGAYPTNFLKFIDTVFGQESNTIEVCSRTVKGLNQQGNCFTVDINPEFRPDLIADGQILAEIQDNRFSRWRCDPPYNETTAKEMYNTEFPNVSKLLKQGSRVVKSGSLLFLLHSKHGPSSIEQLRRIGYLTISIIPNNETRILNIYVKLPLEEMSN